MEVCQGSYPHNNGPNKVHSNTEIQFKLKVMSFKVCTYIGVFKNRMLEVIKNINDFVLYCIVLLRVISVMNIFPQ